MNPINQPETTGQGQTWNHKCRSWIWNNFLRAAKMVINTSAVRNFKSSNLIFTAFQLICETWRLQIVWRQDFLIGNKFVDVLTIVHYNSVRDCVTGGVNAFTQNITIFVLNVLQTNGAQCGCRYNKRKNRNQKVDNHVLVNGHEAVFLEFQAVGRGSVWKLKNQNKWENIIRIKYHLP